MFGNFEEEIKDEDIKCLHFVLPYASLSFALLSLPVNYGVLT